MATAIREYPRIFAAALFQEALKVQKASMNRTPVEFGPLKASHETERPKVTVGGDISTRIKVGGPSAPYAPAVHFRDEVKHSTGESRFLEKSLNEAASTLGRNVGATAKRKIEAKMRRG